MPYNYGLFTIDLSVTSASMDDAHGAISKLTYI